MRFWPLAVVCGLAAALIYLSPSMAGPVRALKLETAKVAFSVNDREASGIGRLKWLGTIRLTSDDKDFGGLSGLIVSDDGARFLAITDTANWVTGKLTYTNGRLTGAEGGMIAPMLDEKGEPMIGKQGDAEGLDSAWHDDVDGPVYVSFEGHHRIWKYGPWDNGQRHVTGDIPLPDVAKALDSNGGLEALAVLSPWRIFAAAEYGKDANGDYPAWILPLDLKGGAATSLSVEPKPPFSVTDAKLGPDGDLYILERAFSRQTGVATRLRRVPSADIAAAKSLKGEELALMGMSFVIDNMEGLALRRGPAGQTLVYVVSDDNFNAPLQQTLLMMFEVEN